LPIFLPLAVFLFDVLASCLVLGQQAHAAASLSRPYSRILIPGSWFLSPGAAVSFNVALAGLIEWFSRRHVMTNGRVKMFLNFWFKDEGQDIAEYAVMLAVILVLVVGTVRLIGSHANNVFSQAASSIQ
jgi:Flp pilus assembly pilin Flp